MFKEIKKFIYTKILRRKYYRKGNCLGCGKCCKKIYVQTSKHVIQEEKEFEKLKLLHRFYTYLTVVGKDETGLVFACLILMRKLIYVKYIKIVRVFAEDIRRKNFLLWAESFLKTAVIKCSQ